MKLDELQSVQSRERQTDQLQQLRATFYEEAGQFVAQLREERDRAAERAEDPFDSPEVNRLTDDIKTAEQTVEAIYERRVGKIVKMASLAAADMPTEDGGLTQEERELFETMVEAIEGNRRHVLDVVAGEAPTGAVGDGASETTPDSTGAEPGDVSDSTDSDPAVDAADIMGGGDGAPTEAGDQPAPAGGEQTDDAFDRPAGEASAVDGGPEQPPTEPESGAADGPDQPSTGAGDEPGRHPTEQSDGPAAGADIDRKTVRITDEVGEIFGVDQRSYDLSTDDVVTLPADNADPLVERDAAEPLE